MKKRIVLESIAAVCILVGVVVMVGWFFDIVWLKSFFPFGVTMKFATALSFTLTGLLVFTFRCGWRELQVSLATAQVLIMGVFLVGNLLGVSIGVEKVFFSAADLERFTGVPGYPSVMTCVLFVLVSLAVLFCQKLPKCLPVVGGIMILTGSLAIIGYAFGIPALYYYVRTLSSLSTAMALHTAILFTLLGIGFAFFMKKKDEVLQ